MDDFNLIVALLGGITLLLGLASKPLARSPFPPTLLALVIGVAVGPEALGLLDPETLGQRSDIMEKAARLTLGIGLVGVALRVPRAYPRQNWRALLVLIGLGMLLMWAVTTALVYFILGLPFWLAALTPTDPVAASPIVTGTLAEDNIPERVRHAISFESGANDGLSYAFVFLPLLLLTRPAGEALSHWATHTLLWEVGAATAFGLLLGFGTGKLLQAAERRGTIERHWRLVYTVALALLAVGAGKLIHSDEVLVVFAAGAMFTQVVSGEDRENEEQGQEAVNRFFAIPIFILLGTALPWEGWGALGLERDRPRRRHPGLPPNSGAPSPSPAAAGSPGSGGRLVRRLVRPYRRSRDLLCRPDGTQAERTADVGRGHPRDLRLAARPRSHRRAADPALRSHRRSAEGISQRGRFLSHRKRLPGIRPDAGMVL